MTASDLSARGQLREWFEERISERGPLDMAKIESEAKALFFPDLEWVDAMFGSMVGHELRCLLSQFRKPAYAEIRATKKNKGLPTIEEMRSRANDLAAKWGRWYIQTSKGYVCILDATRPQLIEDAEKLEAHAEGTLGRARLERAIAAEMQNDKERVKKRLTYDELEAIQKSIKKEVDQP